MAHEVKAFGCDTCTKVYARKAGAARHEKRCWDNPELRACKTCDHLDYEKPEHDVGIAGGYFCTEGHGTEDGTFTLQHHCQNWAGKDKN